MKLHEIPKATKIRKENYFKRLATAGLVSGLLLLNGCASTQVQQTRQAESEYQRRDAELVRQFPARAVDPRRTSVGGVQAYEIMLTRRLDDLVGLETRREERRENGEYRYYAEIQNMAYAEFRMGGDSRTFRLFWMREGSQRTPNESPVHTCEVSGLDDLARIIREDLGQDFTRARILFEPTTGSVVNGRRQVIIDAYLLPLTPEGNLIEFGNGFLVARAEFNHAFREVPCIQGLAVLMEPGGPRVASGERRDLADNGTAFQNGARRSDLSQGDIPRVQRPSSEAIAFARNPESGVEIGRIFNRHTIFESGGVRIESAAAYDDFRRLVGSRFSEDDTRRIFRYLMGLYLNEARATGVEMARSDAGQRAVSLAILHGTSIAGAELGHGTVIQNDTAVLNIVLEGNGQREQEEILRAALGNRFSLDSVTAAANSAGIGNSTSVTETSRQMTVLEMLRIQSESR
ncbi:MAG: hypothetical protein AB1324_07650 [Candidatus Micrarchaeota archaeon]